MKNKKWWNYSEIRFTAEEVLWILENMELLRGGEWPPEHKNSGYIDASFGEKRIKSEAGFVKPVIIISEIEVRLDRTGVDGKLLLAEAKLGVDIALLSYEAKRALKYISGWRRKRMSYQNWVSQSKYRKGLQSANSI